MSRSSALERPPRPPVAISAADVIRVGLAHTAPHYSGLTAPWDPGDDYPELKALWGETAHAAPPNHVYAALRDSLRALGLDAASFGSAQWNPLGEWVKPGAHIVLKPNFIRHWNPCDQGSVESVTTHGSLLRAVADYAFLAAGKSGRVTLAEAPQHDCDWGQVTEQAGIPAMLARYREIGRTLEVVDLRREAVRYRDGVIVARDPLPGDPAGYRLVDLANASWFSNSGLDPQRFRGADYEPSATAEHHMNGRNEYLLSESVLSADLVVNLPKLKTHKKTGVTLALKNLVGINGDKNLLPHHCVGSVAAGGDEYPGESLLDRARSTASEAARVLLSRGIGTRLVRLVRRAESATRGTEFVRSGNWHGNRTTWRMCLDLNRCLYYSDANGEYFDADAPTRKILTVCDGVVAGEGEGPLAPRDRPLGVVLAATDPIALDLAAVELMGFDWTKLPKLYRAIADEGLRITEVHHPRDVEVMRVGEPGSAPESCQLADLVAREPFLPHVGWANHVEASRTSPGT